MDQISLPKDFYIIYNFFELHKNLNEDNNIFKFLKNIMGLDIYIAKNISNLNYYQVNIPISNNLKPEYLIKYISNINYKNLFTPDCISFKIIENINENKWIEEEIFNNNKNTMCVNKTKFQIIYYSLDWKDNKKPSEIKFYQAYKIFKNEDKWILKLELVLNNYDIDQDIDIEIQVLYINKLLEIIYKKFKIDN